MPNLLAIETSSPHLSLAAKKENGPVREIFMKDAFRRGENLAVMIPRLLRRSGLRLREVDHFLIGRGPGSFTGLRIGFATLKGFLAIDKKPCYGALSLDMIARSIHLPDGSVLGICLDAYREKLYTRFYKRTGSGWKPVTAPAPLTVDKLRARFCGEVYLAGDALRRYRKIFEEIGHASSGNFRPRFLPEKAWYPKASALITLYLERGPEKKRTRFGIQRLGKPIDFIPFYLRRSGAEEKRKIHAAAC